MLRSGAGEAARRERRGRDVSGIQVELVVVAGEHCSPRPGRSLRRRTHTILSGQSRAVAPDAEQCRRSSAKGSWSLPAAATVPYSGSSPRR